MELVDINGNKRKIPTSEELTIFGYGKMGLIIYDALKQEYPQVKISFVDNNENKLGLKKEGEVFPLSTVKGRIANSPCGGVIIGSAKFRHDMLKNLRDIGIRDEYIFDYPSDLITFHRKMTPLKKIHFETDIADHCNLNCRYCSVYLPVAEEGYYDFDRFEQDIIRMSGLFNGEASYIHLIGGEPLLNKRIKEYMTVLRECFPVARLNIFTNGILLFQMSKEFYDVCRELDFHILVTQYPSEINYVGMKELVIRNNVKFDFVRIQSVDFEYERRKMIKLAMDPEGKQDALESYMNCLEPNECIKLRDGRLYMCVRPAVIDRYNKRFGKKCIVSDKDYIDIYKAKSGKEVLDFLASGPIPFCRYCDMRGREVGYEWGKSTGDISEWTYMG